MTLILWKVTHSHVEEGGDYERYWVHRDHFATTTSDQEREDLIESLVEYCDADHHANAERILEVSTYEVHEIVKVLSLTLPPRRCRLCGMDLERVATSDICGQCLQGELETEPELRIPGAV